MGPPRRGAAVARRRGSTHDENSRFHPRSRLWLWRAGVRSAAARRVRGPWRGCVANPGGRLFFRTPMSPANRSRTPASSTGGLRALSGLQPSMISNDGPSSRPSKAISRSSWPPAPNPPPPPRRTATPRADYAHDTSRKRWPPSPRRQPRAAGHDETRGIRARRSGPGSRRRRTGRRRVSRRRVVRRRRCDGSRAWTGVRDEVRGWRRSGGVRDRRRAA